MPNPSTQPGEKNWSEMSEKERFVEAALVQVDGLPGHEKILLNNLKNARVAGWDGAEYVETTANEFRNLLLGKTVGGGFLEEVRKGRPIGDFGGVEDEKWKDMVLCFTGSCRCENSGCDADTYADLMTGVTIFHGEALRVLKEGWSREKEERQQSFERMKEAMQVLAKKGVPNELFYLGHMGDQYEGPYLDEKTLIANLNKLVEVGKIVEEYLKNENVIERELQSFIREGEALKRRTGLQVQDSDSDGEEDEYEDEDVHGNHE